MAPGLFDKYLKSTVKGIYCRYPGILGTFQSALLDNLDILLKDGRFTRAATHVMPMQGQKEPPRNPDNSVDWRKALKTDYFLLEYPETFTIQYSTRIGTRTKNVDVVDSSLQALFFPWLYVLRADPEELPRISCWREDLDWGIVSNCSIWARIALQGADISLGIPKPTITPDDVHLSMVGARLSPHHTLYLEPRPSIRVTTPSTVLRVKYDP